MANLQTEDVSFLAVDANGNLKRQGSLTVGVTGSTPDPIKGGNGHNLFATDEEVGLRWFFTSTYADDGPLPGRPKLFDAQKSCGFCHWDGRHDGCQWNVAANALGGVKVCPQNKDISNNWPEWYEGLNNDFMAYASACNGEVLGVERFPTGSIPFRKGHMNLMISCLLVAALSGAVAAKAAIVFQDDFETLSPRDPPPGWAMWGADKFKVPAHYTLDTTSPHLGRQCFRIYHPASTGGYIVLAPERAIHPKPATIYTVSFWARLDKPGRAMFQWTAYQTISPFTDSPSPGSLPFQAGAEWKEFTFSVREGLDFFADQSQFLLLTFMAAADQKEERTLWIDDVRVSEEPDPNPTALVNEATIAHEPLQHRLRPGDQLEFTVDPTRRLGRVARQVGGVSFHRVCGWTGQPYNRQGDYTLLPELESAIRELQLPMTRFYAVGDEPFGLESAIDKVAEVCRRVGVAQDRCVLEFEEQGACTKLPAEVWARGVRHSLERGFEFHHWEIANEPSSSLWGQGHAFPTPEAFIEHFKTVSSAIRQADPKAQIGLDINVEQVRWGNYILKQLAGHYDFVAPHYYCGANVHQLPFEEVVLTENYRMLDRILRVGALLRAYNPDREVSQDDTEWGMICRTPDGQDADYEDRNANIIGTIHRAVRLIYYAREGFLRGASGWQMLSRRNAQGFGILSQDAPSQRFMLYWLYYYFNRHLGEWALLTEGTAPYFQPDGISQQFGGPITPSFASLSKDGRVIYLVIANGSWSRSLPCRATVRAFGRFRGTGVVLGNNNPDGKPLLENKQDALSGLPLTVTEEEVNCSLPPHSVVFVTLTKE